MSTAATFRRMGARIRERQLPARDLEAILGVTSALAAPFDLMTMLAEVVRAAKQVLQAERGSVWRIAPLLTVSTDEIDRAVDILDRSLRQSLDELAASGAA